MAIATDTWFPDVAKKRRSRYPQEFIGDVEKYRALILPEWSVELHEDREPEDDEPLAEAIWDDHAFIVRIWFSDDLINSTNRFKVRQTIVHELMHPLFRDMRQQFARIIDDFHPKHAAAEEDMREHFEEVLVERVSRSVCPELMAVTVV